MTAYPWRFQADLKPGEPNPDVTVFVGDTITNDTTGEQTIHQDTSNPETVKLNDLSNYVAAAMTSGIVRSKASGPGPSPPETQKK
jgi:hypothetical protein